jgi:crotonobetaine/carnitine-CoA ligase
LCADYTLAEMQKIRSAVPGLDWAIVLDSREDPGSMSSSDVPGAESYAAIAGGRETYPDVRIDDPNDALEIVYTSGTTGDPKGVVCSNLRYTGATFLAQLLNFAPDERPYNGLSLTHGNAQMITLAPCLGMKHRGVFSRKFTKSRLWDVCREHGCTVFNLLGGMATAIYSEPPRSDDADNPVRFVVSAGMPLGLWDAFEKRFDLKVLEVYGAIEGGLAINPIGVGPKGSFGKPPLTIEMRVVDDDGNTCAPGAVGELVSRPTMPGEEAKVEYFKDEAASKAKTRGGWLRSGDMCHTDANGWFYFDYRKGGAIRHNGDFVNPGFVERVIAEHPLVDDVFVYGVPAASGAPGEKDVVAAIVPVKGKPFDPNALFEACARGLEPNFVPSFLQVVEEIPKTASEKPQERFLLERFKVGAAGVYSR